jgi:hypothetical protein
VSEVYNPGQGPVGAGLGALPPPVAGQPTGPGAVPPALAAQLAAIGQATAVEQPDGSVILEMSDPTLAGGDPAAHGDNIAAQLEPSVLSALAGEVLEGIDADRESNAEFFESCTKGIALLGLKPERRTEPFDGASGAVHPMLLEAVVRFVANAHAELLPAAGPARSLIVGTGAAEQLEGRAQRKQAWLNYFLTVVDPDYYPDFDGGLLKLALYGSVFRKVYRDPISGQPRSRYLTPLDLLVSWSASSLRDAQRATQLEQVSPVEAERRMLTGYYRDVSLGQAVDEETPGDAASRAQDGRRPTGRPEDAEGLHYHCHCWLSVPGFEHVDPETQQPTGLRLPWILTVDATTREVLRLEQDWEDGDPLFRRREHYSHYCLHPGLGFYGWGFVTLLGASTDTASSLWRMALDAFTFASFPGGLRVKSARPEHSNVSIGPCQFAEVDTGGLPIQQAVMPLPYRDVPPSFAPLMESIVTAGQRLGQTGETQVGEGRQDAPVGTTVALIEQAIRPTAAMIKRLFVAQRHELSLFCKLFASAPQARYPYLVDGKRGVALGQDFSDAADIVPVCDPNAPTQTQRLALAEGKLRLASTAPPGMFDLRAAYQGMLRVLGADEAEIGRLMPPPRAGQPADVVTEFALALQGQPLAAGPTQMHEAHLRAHIAQMQMPNLPPPIVQALLGHCGDHLAMWYAALVSQAVGMPVVPGQPLPPEVEAQVAVAVAQASQQIVAIIGPALGGLGGDPLKAQDLARKEAELEFKIADSARKSEETARQDAVEVLLARLEADQARDDVAQRDRELRVKVMELLAREQEAVTRRAEAASSGRDGGGGPPRRVPAEARS